MPNTFISLDVPDGDGSGTPAFVGLTGHPKTFVIGGAVAPGTRYVVEGSNDGTTWDILVDDDDGTQVLYTTGATGVRSVDCMVQQVRVRAIAAALGIDKPSITMGAPPANGTPIFGALDVPRVSGVGASFDLGLATGPLKTFILRGKAAPGARYSILASMDGSQFDEVLLFTSDQEGARSRSVMCRFVRVQRAAAGPTPVITIGAEGLLVPGIANAPSSAELSIASERELATVTRNEEVLAEYAVPLSTLNEGRLVLDFSGIGGAVDAMEGGGYAVFRVRQGGTLRTPDGVELAALELGPAEMAGAIRSMPFDRPADSATLVKVTGRGSSSRAALRGFALRFQAVGS
jgi:hypothetical protein